MESNGVGSLFLEIAFIGILVIANGVFSMAEMAVVSSRKARLQIKAEEGDKGAQTALDLVNSPNQFLSTIQIGITMIGVMTGAFGGATIAEKLVAPLRLVSWIAPHAEIVSFGLVVLGITYLSLVFGELVPKRIALNHAETISAAMAPAMKMLSTLTLPAVHFFSLSTDLVLKMLGIQPSTESAVTEEEVKLMIEQGTQSGVFELSEQKMVERVFRLGDLSVSALMTPRPDIIWLDPDDSVEDIRLEIMTTGHSHYPVAEGQIDRIIGLVDSMTLLSQSLNAGRIDLRAALRPAMFVSEYMSAMKVLERFKEKHAHAAFVIDEHGDFQGMVTTNDILEAIAGDIPMPDDAMEDDIIFREDGSWLVDGKILADELKDLLDVDSLPFENEHRYQTLGGMVMAILGRIPISGEHFDWSGFCFEVVDMDGHRVDKVLIKPSTVNTHPAV
jgi:putative hemolysin